MATDLDGIFNFGLKGLRDRNVFDKWLEDLKALNLEKAHDHDGIEEIGEWESYITGYGGDDSSENEPNLPYEKVKELLIEQYGTPKTTYKEMAEYGEKLDFEYKDIDVFLVDKIK